MPSQKEPKRTAQTEPSKSKSKQGEPASRSQAQSDTRHEPGHKTSPPRDEGKQR